MRVFNVTTSPRLRVVEQIGKFLADDPPSASHGTYIHIRWLLQERGWFFWHTVCIYTNLSEMKVAYSAARASQRSQRVLSEGELK